MKIRIHDFLNLLARWRGEHARVQDQATSANLSRLRAVAPLVAALNAVHVLIFALQLVRAPVDSNRYRWAVGLLITHLTMGLTMLAVAGLVVAAAVIVTRVCEPRHCSANSSEGHDAGSRGSNVRSPA